jgi:cystathionine beta-lyase/cystathionine gamma-synthase
MHRILGGSLDPFAAFLLHRGMKTLPLRIARQNENGRALAEALTGHPAVSRVYYPGLGDAAQEAIAARQMSGRGGMVSFSLRGGAPAADRFLRKLRLAHVAASLGGVESLVSLPSMTSHALLDPAARAALGIDDGLIRLSVGIEETPDLLRDFLGALDGR